MTTTVVFSAWSCVLLLLPYYYYYGRCRYYSPSRSLELLDLRQQARRADKAPCRESYRCGIKSAPTWASSVRHAQQHPSYLCAMGYDMGYDSYTAHPTRESGQGCAVDCARSAISLSILSIPRFQWRPSRGGRLASAVLPGRSLFFH
jgi:hypothetical protein